MTLTQEWRDRKSGDGVNLRMGYAPLTQLDLGSLCLDFKLEEETIADSEHTLLTLILSLLKLKFEMHVSDVSA